MIDVEALHRAAEKVWAGVGTAEMDALAQAGADFLHTSKLTDETGAPLDFDTKSIGYGIMLGYIAAREELTRN
jgi:hypothetical protein